MTNAEKREMLKFFEKREKKRKERNIAKRLRQQMIAFVVANHLAKTREGAIDWLKHHGFFPEKQASINKATSAKCL